MAQCYERHFGYVEISDMVQDTQETCSGGGCYSDCLVTFLQVEDLKQVGANMRSGLGIPPRNPA